nr:AraC family transcriptional regulator [Vibrio hepatarius]
MHKAYWLGQSISYVKKDTVRDLEEYFNLLDFGYDVSVLSESDTHFCFFFYEKNFDSLFLTASKICQNLNKHIILIYKDNLCLEVEKLDIVLSTLNLNENTTKEWAEELSKKIYCQFNNHHEVLETYKAPELIEQKVINKDLVEILRYIDNNLSRKIREQDIAEYCHYSVTYFSRFFHQTIGVCFRDYLTFQRINLAKQLLSEKKEKISFIAFQCGYNDVSYFSRIFKKKTGLSPAIYRQLH